jgi:hypothetical protein
MPAHLRPALHAAAAAVLALGPLSAAAVDIHYLSVGNASYADDTLSIPDANTSARQIAGLLRRIGAAGGETLLSQDDARVTAADVREALERVADAAASAADPLVVYYFIGHGRTAEPGGIHVSLTGVYDGSEATDASSRIQTDELRDILDERGLAYILILDNCYYREPVEGVVGLARAVNDKFFDLGRLVAKQDFRQLDRVARIALYAASPGNVVRTLPHPKSDAYAIGPLARRLLLLLDEAPEDGLSVQAWLDRMTDQGFDSSSVPGKTDAEVDAPGATLIRATRLGSAGGG